MAYAIFRVKKHKTMSAIAGIGRHADRIQDTPNADPTKPIIDLVPTGGKTLQDIASDRLENVWRINNAVLCAEIFLGASPEFFRPHNPDQYGVYNKELLKDWIDKNIEFLNQEFGDNLVKCKLHLDEATPHIHAYVLPIFPHHRDSEREKLSYRKLFGGSKWTMNEWQTKYANAMQNAGFQLQRGTEGNKRKHIEIRDRYRDLPEIGHHIDRSRELDSRDRQLAEREAALVKRAQELREELQAERDRVKREQEQRANEDRARAIFHMLSMLNRNQKNRFNKLGYTTQERDGEKILYGIALSESGENIPRELVRLRDGWPEPGRDLQKSDMVQIKQQCQTIVQNDARKKKSSQRE